MDATETDDPSVVGEEAHIVGREPGGPRGASDLPPEHRDRYANLVLLCAVHHKVIDDQPTTYSVERLHEMKAAHEKWVREQLTDYDAAKQRDEESYAGIVEEWADRADLKEWRAWSNSLLGPQPRLREERAERLNELSDWLFSRIWPKRHAELEAAFRNFLDVLQDTLHLFYEEAEKNGEVWVTRRFYRLGYWDPEGYHRQLDRFNYHVALLGDLILELTRAANYVCDKVRQYVDPPYRLREGAVLAESGDILGGRLYRPEYEGRDCTTHPYPGLDAFARVRETRDVHFGSGPPPQ
jgi:hypothetical protein